MSTDEIDSNVKELEKEAKITLFRLKNDIYIWHKSYEIEIEDKIVKYIDEFHKRNPYKTGIKKSEIKSKFFSKIKQNVFDEIINNLIMKELLNQSNDFLSIIDFKINEDQKFNLIKNKILNVIEEAGYNFVKLSQIIELDKDKMSIEDILATLAEREEIIKVAEDTFTSRKLIEVAKNEIINFLNENNKISAAEYRDLLETNRKSAIALLEYFDNIKLTKRCENDRVLNKI